MEIAKEEEPCFKSYTQVSCESAGVDSSFRETLEKINFFVISNEDTQDGSRTAYVVTPFEQVKNDVGVENIVKGPFDSPESIEQKHEKTMRLSEESSEKEKVFVEGESNGTMNVETHFSGNNIRKLSSTQSAENLIQETMKSTKPPRISSKSEVCRTIKSTGFNSVERIYEHTGSGKQRCSIQ